MSVKLRPGLEKYTGGKRDDDRLDSAIGSMTCPFEDGDSEEAQPNARLCISPKQSGTSAKTFDGILRKTDTSELRAGLEKFKLDSKESTGTDSGIESLQQRRREEEITAIMEELNVSSPPVYLSDVVPTAAGCSVRRAMSTITVREQADDDIRCRSAAALYRENNNCHNYACTGDERYLMASFRTLLLSPNQDGDT